MSIKRRPCKLCGSDLNLWGDYKGRPCPDCQTTINSTMIECAGKCGKRHQKKYLSRVVINWEPGSKNATKTVLYYCRDCLAVVSSRAMRISNVQYDAIEGTKERLLRKSSRGDS